MNDHSLSDLQGLPATQHMPEVQLDTRGLNCPEPLMMLHQAIRRAAAGQQIRILATDPSTMRDIPKFCLHLGHHLQEQPSNPQAKELVFLVQKRHG